MIPRPVPRRPCPRAFTLIELPAVRRRERAAFTLIELLVVIGIIAVLLGILLPAITKVRGAAMKTVCAARLRDLAQASIMFRNDRQSLPLPPRNVTVLGDPLAPLGEVVPHNMEARLLNELRSYLKFPEVAPGTPVRDVPHILQCPFVEAAEDDRGPFLPTSPLNTYYHTGYLYVARLDEAVKGTLPLAKIELDPGALGLGGLLPPVTLPTPSVLTGAILKPRRAANARATQQAVVWADDVHFSLAPQPHWHFSHARGHTTPGPLPRTYGDTKGLLGQNRAYTDAHVEWVPVTDLKLEPAAAPRTPALLDTAAAFKLTGSYYWWY